MQIAKGIEMLEISVPVMGRPETIYPVLIWDEHTVLLVDTGHPGLLDKLKEAVAAAGVPWARLHTVLITHQDLDHIGSLPAILEDAPGGITVLAHAAEKPYIEGDRMLLKHTPEALEAAEAMLPDSVPEAWKQAFLSILAHPPKGRVDQTLTGGEILPVAGGLAVINTPGHSPGHLSLYHPASGTLIAADALTVRGGRLNGPDPAATPDLPGALTSLRQLTAYEIRQVVCYHGGLYRGEANHRIAELAEGKP